MEEKLTAHLGKIDVERVMRELQSPEYKARVEAALKQVEQMKQHAIVDRARLFIPVDF